MPLFFELDVRSIEKNAEIGHYDGYDYDLGADLRYHVSRILALDNSSECYRHVAEQHEGPFIEDLKPIEQI